MKEYKVKVKDLRQDLTHTMSQIARSKREANALVLKFLRKSMGHDEFEVVG